MPNPSSEGFKVVFCLNQDPEIRIRLKRLRKKVGGLRRDAAMAVDDLIHALEADAKVLRELDLRDLVRVEELLLQHNACVDWFVVTHERFIP